MPKLVSVLRKQVPAGKNANETLASPVEPLAHPRHERRRPGCGLVRRVTTPATGTQAALGSALLSRKYAQDYPQTSRAFNL